jgi:hypothetical protein
MSLLAGSFVAVGWRGSQEKHAGVRDAVSHYVIMLTWQLLSIG